VIVLVICLFAAVVGLCIALIIERRRTNSSDREREIEIQLGTEVQRLSNVIETNNQVYATELAELRGTHERELDFIGKEADRLVTEEKHRLELEWAETKRTYAKQSNQRSRTALVAKVAEHMSPYLPGFKYNPKDARHVGEIFDFLIFDGLEAGGPITVVFLEVKSNNRRVTNPREVRLREAIESGRVKYQVFVPNVTE
jgi:predicted Holliday junction resolvase-like endonuclease